MAAGRRSRLASLTWPAGECDSSAGQVQQRHSNGLVEQAPFQEHDGLPANRCRPLDDDGSDRLAHGAPLGGEWTHGRRTDTSLFHWIRIIGARIGQCHGPMRTSCNGIAELTLG